MFKKVFLALAIVVSAFILISCGPSAKSDLETLVESLDQYVAVVVEELVDSGYPEDLIFSEVVEGHGHNEASWKQRFGDALLWLYSDEVGNYTGPVA